MPTWNRNVSMRALRAFCLAVERESFRLAAEDLYLTASAVSHQIRQLEDTIGSQLFSRSARSLNVTDAGRAFYDDLKPILDDLDVIIERNSKKAEGPVLKLSVQSFFASELLVPRLSDFVDENPDISITVDTADGESGTHDRTADVAIRLFTKPPDGLDSDRLFALRLIPVGSPGFYDRVKVVAGRIKSDFPLIVHDSRPKAWQKWQRSSGIRLPRNPKIIRLNSMTSVARAAEQGLGAALMPAQLCCTWMESGALTQLFDHELESSEAYYLISPESAADTGHSKTFRDWVLQEFTFGS
ncbi:MAG: LysR family transcriptional regulator [Chromatiales bacterium]|nr:MAG: LysR family transcriptional regulator [Chromatiales bacterium]